MPATHWIGLSMMSLLFATWSRSTRFLGNSFIICDSKSGVSIDIFLIESSSLEPSIIFESINIKEAGSSSNVAPIFYNFNFSLLILVVTYSYIYLSLYLKSIPSFPYLFTVNLFGSICVKGDSVEHLEAINGENQWGLTHSTNPKPSLWTVFVWCECSLLFVFLTLTLIASSHFLINLTPQLVNY